MLNLKKEKKKLEYFNKSSKDFPSSIREWNNSIYVYNKKTLSSIPTTSFFIIRIIKNYFHFFAKKLERKIRKKNLFYRKRRISCHRIFLTKGEFKHTNNKVLINLYLYNRQKYNYLHKLKKKYLKKILNKKGERNLDSIYKKFFYFRRKNKKAVKINKKIIKNLNFIYNKGMYLLKNNNNSKYLLINTLKKNSNYKINLLKRISISTYNFYKKILKKSMKKLFIYFFYKQIIFINKSKLNYTYLQKLKLHLEKVYNKNVEFNLINLNNIFLNSDIMSQVVKLKLTRNRRRLSKLMKIMKNKLKIIESKNLIEIPKKKNLAILNDLRFSGKNLMNTIMENLKYKKVTGFRLEAKGRLTRRNKANRALSKVKYKGALSNKDFKDRKLALIILRGNLKPNIQYTKSYSKSRIGSFGLKGWISGY